MIAKKLQALADDNRLKILELLTVQELPAGSVAKNIPQISRPGVSQHLGILKNCGLVLERRVGTKRIYSINPNEFEEIIHYLKKFWEARLEALKNVIENSERKSYEPRD